MKIVFKKEDALLFLGYCFCLFALVRPAYLETIGILKRIYTLAAPLAMGAILVVFLYKLQTGILNKTMLVICVFILLPVAIAFIRGVSYSPVYYYAPLSWIALVLLLDMGFREHYGPMLSAVAFVLGLYVMVNFATILLYPNALYQSPVYGNTNWFLGYKNLMVRTMLPALAANAVCCVRKKGRFSLMFLMLYASCLLSTLLTDSKTGTLGLLLFGGILYLFRSGEMPEWINLKNIGLLILGASLALTVFDLLSHFSGLIDEIGEAGSIGNRFLVWNRSLELIAQRPVFGYGYMSTGDMTYLLDISTGRIDLPHAHNYMLHILLQGGLVTFGVGLYLYGRIGQVCLEHRGDFTSKVVLAMYISFLVMGLVEALVSAVMLYPMMMLAETVRTEQVKYQKRMWYIKIR